MQTAKHLTKQSEVEHIMSPEGGAAILDFWSPSCGPCRAMSDDYDALAEGFKGEPLQVCKINTAAHPELAAPFRIRAVPTLLFVLDGEIVDANIGALRLEGLAKRAQRLLKKQASAEEPGFLRRLFGG